MKTILISDVKRVTFCIEDHIATKVSLVEGE
jgi:hypothetical protein